MTNEIVVQDQWSVQVERIVAAVRNAANSDLTRDDYERSIRQFFSWLLDNPHETPAEAIAAWKADMQSQALAPATINKKLSAIRQAFQWTSVTPAEMEAIRRVSKGIPVRGSQRGTWLGEKQLRKLLDLPGKNPMRKLHGLRDKAILAILVGTGIRNAELRRITWGQLQQRDGTPVIANLETKHHRVRTIAIPAWAMERIAAWREAYQERKGSIKADAYMFSRIWTGDRIGEEQLSRAGLSEIVNRYAMELGVDFSPHDLRRSFAMYLVSQGVPMRTVQQMMGHSNVAVTEHYLKDSLDVGEAAGLMDILSDKIES